MSGRLRAGSTRSLRACCALAADSGRALTASGLGGCGVSAVTGVKLTGPSLPGTADVVVCSAFSRISAQLSSCSLVAASDARAVFVGPLRVSRLSRSCDSSRSCCSSLASSSSRSRLSRSRSSWIHRVSSALLVGAAPGVAATGHGISDCAAVVAATCPGPGSARHAADGGLH